MHRLLLVIVLTSGLVAPTFAYAQVLAQVGGTSITLHDVIAADPAAAKNAAIRNKVLLVLIDRQAVLNEAKRRGVEKSEKYKRAVKQARDNIAVQLMAQQFAASHPVTEKEIKAAYQKAVNKPYPEQYRLREISVDSYKAAQGVIAQLKAGRSFSILATEESQDPHAQIGGETGWLAATQLLAPILKAVKPLKVGEVAGPVAVPKGYVVLQLLGKRPMPKPALDQVKQKLTEVLRQQAWNAYVIKLRTEQGAHLIVALPKK